MSHHHRRAAAVSAPDPYFSSTVLLLTGNGTNGGQNNTFLDDSSNNFTITRNGNTTQGSFSPFTGAGGSGYFDGTGDYLTLNAGNSVDFGSGNFTIEGWVYPVGNQGAYDSIIARSTTTSPRFAVSFGSDGTTLECWCDGISASRVAASSTNVVNSWHHFAFVRNGTLFTLYVDGVAGATTTTSSSAIGASTDSVHIGADPSNLTGRVFNGYISSFRILKGTAQYSSTFTPSTTPLTAITNTSLLLNFVNGSIVDATGKNDLETVGDAQISTSVKKFGTGALKFDGTGDALLIPKSSLFDFGTGDFTIEAWVYPTATGAKVIVDARSFDNLGAYVLSISNTEKLDFIYSSSRVTSSGSISQNTWTHVAAVRSSGTIKLYINGTEDGSASFSSAINANQSPAIGGGRSTGGSSITGYYFNGYIDDLRITKTARYTANFTPPYRQLPTR